MKKLLVLLLLVLVATTALAQNKSRIVGTVTTEDGSVITGVQVTLVSDALIASQLTTTTNERGMFRFVLLPVGSFTIKFEKEGYKTIEQADVSLGFDSTLTIDKVLVPSDFEEVITITGEAPIVDKTSSSFGDKLDMEFLKNQPNTRDIWSMPNMTAGYTDDSAFGGVTDSGNAYNADGVNISDPSTGTTFASINMEAVEQMDINMFGANAEYGGFTGASINVVTKSGGNEFHGEANFWMQRVDWVDDNTEEYDLINTPTASDLDDVNGALGGPVIKDKIWFFGSAMKKNSETQRQLASGPTGVTHDQKRYFGKVSARWDDRNISYGSYIHFERDLSHRLAAGAWVQNYDNSCWRQEGGDDTFLLQHSFVLNENVIAEARFARFKGTFDLIPREYGMFLWDNDLGGFSPDSYSSYIDMNKRVRNNLLLTTNYFNDDLAGSHSFKFGFEYEKSSGWRRRDMQLYEEVWYGLPYMKMDWGDMRMETDIERYAGFVQDSWSATNKLTINYGVRVDRTGFSAGDESVDPPFGDEEYMNYFDLSPRLGFAYDIFGDGKTVLRGSAGRYFEGALTGNTEALSATAPSMYTWYSEWVFGGSGTNWILYNVSGGSNFAADEDISNQYTDGFSIGIEREINPKISVSGTFVYRKDYDMIGVIRPDMTFDQTTYSRDGYNGIVYTNIVYGSPSLLTNPKKGDPGVLMEPERTYWGLVFTLDKRFSDRWSLKASYAYSRNEGTVGNSDFGIIQGYDTYSDPNSYINNGGRLGLERPHVFKASGTYVAPFDIYISPQYTWAQGTSYSDYFIYQGDSIAMYKNEGDYRYEAQANLDIRVEKVFTIEKFRLGLVLDVFNVFNDDAVYGWSRNVDSPLYHEPTSIVSPRFYQAGIRLIF